MQTIVNGFLSGFSEHDLWIFGETIADLVWSLIILGFMLVCVLFIYFVFKLIRR